MTTTPYTPYTPLALAQLGTQAGSFRIDLAEGTIFETRLDELMAHGLQAGLGAGTPGALCVEQAVALALGEPLSDAPMCVHGAVRAYIVGLNDAQWSTPQERAKGMRPLALAQLGTAGWTPTQARAFRIALAERTIRRVLPIALRAAGLDEAAARCESEGTQDSADAAAGAARAVHRRAANYATHASHVAHAAARAAEAAAAYAARAADAAGAFAAAHASCANARAAGVQPGAIAAAADDVLQVAGQVGVDAIAAAGRAL